MVPPELLVALLPGSSFRPPGWYRILLRPLAWCFASVLQDLGRWIADWFPLVLRVALLPSSSSRPPGGGIRVNSIAPELQDCG
eukprot:12249745-Alexandrium_andersonii.AAC.1